MEPDIADEATATAEVGDEVVDEGKSKKDKADCSHRVIEKRRRDRINNSLLQLSKLVPVEQFNKKNSAKLEKAEILEVTVQYLTQQRQLQEQEQKKSAEKENHVAVAKDDVKPDYITVFLHGFKECISDATKFFQEVEELDVSEGRCHRLIQHLKKHAQSFEKNEKAPSRKDDRVWEGDDAKKKSKSKRDSSGTSQAKAPSEGMKRKSEEGAQGSAKKQRGDKTGQRSSNTANQESSGSGCESDISSSSGESSDSAARHMLPFMFPQMPFFPGFFPGAANGMPRYPTPPGRFPGYPFGQGPYVPVPMAQFPYMSGMGIIPGFQMMNGEQDQANNAMNLPNAGDPMTDGMSSGTPNGVVNGMMNSFLPSMYSNGVYANMMAVRPRDSGYESSDRSSSSKDSRNESSPPSFSDDSCQSFNVT